MSIEFRPLLGHERDTLNGYFERYGGRERQCHPSLGFITHSKWDDTAEEREKEEKEKNVKGWIMPKIALQIEALLSGASDASQMGYCSGMDGGRNGTRRSHGLECERLRKSHLDMLWHKKDKRT